MVCKMMKNFNWQKLTENKNVVHQELPLSCNFSGCIRGAVHFVWGE